MGKLLVPALREEMKEVKHPGEEDAKEGGEERLGEVEGFFEDARGETKGEDKQAEKKT